jgi:hydrocephalus-inducing protein
VAVDDSDAGTTLVMVPNRSFPLKYGQVYLKEKKVKVISITNGGKYPFDYSFQKPDSRHITIIPESSVVPKGETVQAQVIFYPTVETSIESCVSMLQLTNGPKFPFTFSGLGRRPALRFSSQKIEFGHCFLHQQGLEAPSYMLKLVNEDASDISFDLLFDNKQHLEVDATPAILKPGDSIDIKVSFMPREVTAYSETLAFEVNGMYTINVGVTGEGEERLVQLANPAQSTMDLGSVLVNSMQNRTFKIVNKSHATAVCSLVASAKALLERSISIRPTEFNLRGKTSIDIEMFFSPKSRMAQFSSDVVLEVSGADKQLMVISGRATGLETKLETDTLFFGAVVANSRAVRRVALENTGDVGARFKWDAARFAPAFSVKPVEGFLQSHGEITFEVSFHPTQVNDDIRYEKIPLFVEGGDGHALTLTGMCVTQAPVAEPISFNVAARQLQTKPSPAIANPTDVPWTIKPVFDHEYWSGAETLDIPAGKSVTYDVKFRPLAMAAADKPHKGSLFLPLPNGTALLYQLVGVVGDPAVEGEMDLTTKAKEALVIPIKAVNWLKRSQRFKVSIELDSSNPAVSLKGPEFIDVPGLLQRECKLKFYSYVEGAFKAKITLVNEDTKEYQVFKVAVKATTADVFGKASIEASVRSSASHSFSIDNSLSADVTLKCSSNNPDVRVPPTLLLPARSTRTLDVKYRPLLAGQGSAKVEATCAELGTFVFDVAVKAAAAGADRSLSFRAPLGTTDVQTFRFNHLLADKADYKVTVDGADFVVDAATVAAPAAGAPPRVAAVFRVDFAHDFAAAGTEDGTEVSVDVRFEPTGLGERSGRLLLSSPSAGEFICILKGSAQPPRPQGPIEVKVCRRHCCSHRSPSNLVCRRLAVQPSTSRTFIPRPQRSPSHATTLHSSPQTKAGSSPPRPTRP